MGRSRRGGGAGTGRVSLGTPARRGGPDRPAPPLRPPGPLRGGPSDLRPRGSSSSRRLGALLRAPAPREDPLVLRPRAGPSSRRRGAPGPDRPVPPEEPPLEGPPVRGPPDEAPPRDGPLPRAPAGFELPPAGRPDLEGDFEGPELRPPLPLDPPRDAPAPRPDGDWGDIATSWFVCRRIVRRAGVQGDCTVPDAHRRGTNPPAGNGSTERTATLLKTTSRAGPMTCPRVEKSGGVLLSQGPTSQVPSALEGLTSVFGMGTGVTPPLWPPKSVVNSRVRLVGGSRTS